MADAVLTWEAMMRPMPSTIFCGEISWVELPSPPSKLEVPTSVMPICSVIEPAKTIADNPIATLPVSVSLRQVQDANATSI